MSSYVGRHAELYDLFYQDKPYAQEAAFLDQCIERFRQLPGKRILEIACGTGRHAIELERLGYQVVATDYSPDMVACAKRRLLAASSAVDVRLADMRSLEVPQGAFDAVVCLFDAIGYVLTNEAIRRVLDGVRRALAPGGLFLFEFWHAAAMLRGHDPVRARRWPVERGELIRISETRIDVSNSTAEVTFTIFEPLGDNRYLSLVETQKNRYFQLSEMAALLEASGFGPCAWYAGFSDAAAITPDTWHVVCIARPIGKPQDDLQHSIPELSQFSQTSSTGKGV